VPPCFALFGFCTYVLPAMRYEGKVVIVTGASSGIGYVTARAFAERGATVVAVARRREQLDRLASQCRAFSLRSDCFVGDLGQREFAESVVDETIRRFGRVDVLVNNAGMPMHKHILHSTPDDAERVLRVNYLSCVWTTLAVLPQMLRQGGGAIVNVSSVAARLVPPREGLYAASKAAMNAFTQGLWHDLQGSNIHAALVYPGPIDTEIWSKREELSGYRGRKYPPELAVRAIFEAIEKRRYEITVPKRSPALVAARLLRFFSPALLRWGMTRMDPVPPEIIEEMHKHKR
jgi:short-subunit dehydrogenase